MAGMVDLLTARQDPAIRDSVTSARRDGRFSTRMENGQSQAPPAPSSPVKASILTPGPFRSPKSRVVYSDRLIPSRAATSRLDYSLLEREAAAEAGRPRQSLDPGADPGADPGSSAGAYAQLLRSQLLGCPPPSPDRASGGGAAGAGAGLAPRSPTRSPARKLFRYMAGDAETPLSGVPPASPYARGTLGGEDLAAATPGLASPARPLRRIPRAPFKVLDAPGLSDDFYLNLVDWSSANTLAVGLASAVYLWSALTSKVTLLVDLGPDRMVTSVGWSGRGSYLAVGVDDGQVQIWDVAKATKIRSMEGHAARVGCLAWGSAGLASGSRDAGILLRDPRAPPPFSVRLSAHRSEVCGLRWAHDGRSLASGGNDNLLCVWDARWSGSGGGGSPTPPAGATAPASNPSRPLRRWTDHSAAVKALAWSPHAHGVLASGGGSADRTIRLWNAGTGSCLQTVDTGSQVCCLAWAKNANELVSTHGYSQNQVVVWRYPAMTKLATLTGHTLRVLYLALSPDGQTVVTGAGDETLRFWNVFPEARGKGAAGPAGGVGAHLHASIR
ncbi:hypothetical protein ACKKBG_A07865 [Auxenochlorella protothecoides x Auxenochlorella symbiontica]